MPIEYHIKLPSISWKDINIEVATTGPIPSEKGGYVYPLKCVVSKDNNQIGEVILTEERNQLQIAQLAIQLEVLLQSGATAEAVLELLSTK